MAGIKTYTEDCRPGKHIVANVNCDQRAWRHAPLANQRPEPIEAASGPFPPTQPRWRNSGVGSAFTARWRPARAAGITGQFWAE